MASMRSNLTHFLAFAWSIQLVINDQSSPAFGKEQFVAELDSWLNEEVRIVASDDPKIGECQSGRGYARPVRCCNVCPLRASRAAQFFHFTQHLLAHLRRMTAGSSAG